MVNQLFEDYGNVWPPRGDFTDWPLSWLPYMALCDEMPWKLAQNKEPEAVRGWMREGLKQVRYTDKRVPFLPPTNGVQINSC